jgi:hypothetical protein
MSIFRLIMTVGVIGLLLDLPAVRADQASLGGAAVLPQDITAADVTDAKHSDASAVEGGVYFKDILTRPESDIPDIGSSEMMNILNSGNGLEAAASYDLDIANQGMGAAVLTVPSRGRQAAGIRDLLVPSVFLLLGTALTSFAFFTRRTHKQSRRAYFSRHFFIARPPSRSRSLRTSPSADSSEPNPNEDSGHSSPHRRLA